MTSQLTLSSVHKSEIVLLKDSIEDWNTNTWYVFGSKYATMIKKYDKGSFSTKYNVNT